MISGILAGGIPGFRIELCCFLHPLKWPIGILWLVLFLFVLWACVNMAHKLSFACAEMILCHHLLPQYCRSFSPINWHCHVTAWWFVFVCFLCVLFFLFVFGVVVVFGSLCFVSCSDERDST